MKLKTLSIAIFILLGAAEASEIDSFTKRYAINEDAAPVLNALTNVRIAKALRRANKKDHCSKERLEKSLLKQLKGNVIGGPIEFFVNDSSEDELDRIHLRRRESIYKGLSFLQGRVLKLPLGSFGRIVKIGDHIVGADKFGHFFTEGLVYFKKAKKNGLKSALKWGHKTELGKFGYTTTAVYSRADQVANYSGYLFWKALYKESKGHGPYFSCENNKWVQTKSFNWSDFVDAGWDEGINCSSYRNKKIQKVVETNIANLASDPESASACPIASEEHKCQEVVDKYQGVSKHLVSKKCL